MEVMEVLRYLGAGIIAGLACFGLIVLGVLTIEEFSGGRK